MIASYLRHVDEIAEATPPERNRVVDTWRVVALLVVVLGHWLSASVWVTPDGDRVVMNTLEWIPYAGWFTWVVQVMPIFFFVGGYANARALDNKTTNRRTWIRSRFRRLYTPAVPVIVVWSILAAILGRFIDGDLVYAGVLNATLPVWFLAVYLALVAIAPLTHAWWRSWGWWSVAALAAAGVTMDVAHVRFDVPGVNWVNYLFVWAFVHQLGYAWSDADRSKSVLRPGRAVGMSVAALAGLITVTAAGWYPVAMITIPGGGPTNITPPTMAVALLALIQIGVILATAPAVRRLADQRARWRFVVGVSAFMMSIYLWHLTSLSLTIAVGLFTFDGAAFSIEPGTALWWVTRPLFDILLAAVTAVFVLVFSRFERDINPTFRHVTVPVLYVGIVTCVVALSGTAFVGIVTRDAAVNWWIPAVTIAGAALIGAYPAAWARRRATSNRV